MNWKQPSRTGKAIYALGAIVVGGLSTTLTRMEVARYRGRRAAAQQLPDGPIIVISNHASYSDGLLLALVCRRMGRSLRLLAKDGVFRMPVIGWLAKQVGYIPVERGTSRASDSLEAAIEALQAGEAVGIFPEGRTTRDPEQWPERSKTGAVRMALRTGAPIVPIAMTGTHLFLGRGKVASSFFKSLVLPPEVETLVGEPIDVRLLLDGRDPTPDVVRSLADQVMEHLIDLVEELRGETAPDPIGVPRSEE